MDATPDASLAAIRARNRFGMAMAAMIRMIATTISNSISEKPFCFCIFILPLRKFSGRSQLRLFRFSSYGDIGTWRTEDEGLRQRAGIIGLLMCSRLSRPGLGLFASALFSARPQEKSHFRLITETGRGEKCKGQGERRGLLEHAGKETFNLAKNRLVFLRSRRRRRKHGPRRRHLPRGRCRGQMAGRDPPRIGSEGQRGFYRQMRLLPQRLRQVTNLRRAFRSRRTSRRRRIFRRGRTRFGVGRTGWRRAG